jgi:hypothetical protein
LKKKQLKNLLGSPNIKIKKNNKCACNTFFTDPRISKKTKTHISHDWKKKQLKNLLGSPSLKIKKNNKCTCKTFNKYCEIKTGFQ